MYGQMTDNQILEGFQKGDSMTIRYYFYEYCHTAYHIYDQKYELSHKQNLDFMSLAHQYALYLMEHHWQPLKNRSPNVTLRTWMINGFRYIVLDALKWYKKEYGSITFEDYIRTFDVTDDLRLQFNKTIEDICDYHLQHQDQVIVQLLLIAGFKTRDVAEILDITPSAVSQRYRKIMEKVIIPYFRENFDMNFDMPEMFDEQETVSHSCMPETGYAGICPSEDRPLFQKKTKNRATNTDIVEKRTDNMFINSPEPDEIFVFGSNLRGLHEYGAARMAYEKYGAIMGQGVGLQGQSYAIPTMQGGVDTIKPYVDEFIDFAKKHQENKFIITRIGCDIAGFTDSEISPLFEETHDMKNIMLPLWWR